MSELRDRLVGAWDLVAYTWDYDDGRSESPFGAQPAGMIVYTREGQVAVNMMKPDRPAWTVENTVAGTDDEIIQAVRGYIAYSGSYTVDDAARRVDHHIAASLIPNWVGRTLSRSVDLDDPQLTLTVPAAQTPHGVVTVRVRWRRAARTPVDAELC
jgi:Lipocalin-like domain